MKQRIWALVFALVLMFSLTACGGEPSDGKEPSEPQISQGEKDETKNKQVEAEEPTAEGVGDLGDFHVEVKSAVLTKDHDGAPVIVITYAWTNNSEDTTSAMVSRTEYS